ncbi:MAG TPA: hypothetical protein VGB56_02425 [Flavisolibacter sp.]
MKQYLLVLFFLCAFSGTASAQTLRTCGCKTWNEWKKTEGANREPRREKRKKYAAYRDQCLVDCKTKKEGEPKKVDSTNGTQ